MNEMYDADGNAVLTSDECVVEVVETPEAEEVRLPFTFLAAQLGLTNGD